MLSSNIEDDEVRLFVQCNFEATQTVGGGQHPEPFAFETSLESRAHRALIFDDQDA